MRRISTNLERNTYEMGRMTSTLVRLSALRATADSSQLQQRPTTPAAAVQQHTNNPSTHLAYPSHVAISPRPAHNQNISLKNRCRIFLGDEEFVFDKSKVPPPPMQHFSRNITQLFHEWDKSDLLVINGRGIPVKYWCEVYKRKTGVPAAQQGVWDGLKVTWGNWKV